MCLEHLEFGSDCRHMPRNCAVSMKVMPLGGVKCVAYASGDRYGSLQVTGTALAEAQNFNEGVIEVWILISGCEGAPAFGTAHACCYHCA